MDNSLKTIPGALEVRDGLPRPDWSVVSSWIETNLAASAQAECWDGLAADWLDALIEHLPPGYGRLESENFLLLTDRNPPAAERLLAYCERARRLILQWLAGLAVERQPVRHIVMGFGRSATYYDYITDFYPEEGEFGLSTGMFLGNGLGHIALNLEFPGQHERTIAHELNHLLLSHLPLPLWLDEGVTQVVEDMVVGGSEFLLDHRIARQHRQYWNGETLAAFWSGESFRAPDEGQGLSYALARILVLNMMTDYPEEFVEILNTADYQDGGEAALQAICEESLAERVEQFLGPGEWASQVDYGDPDTAL